MGKSLRKKNWRESFNSFIEKNKIIPPGTGNRSCAIFTVNAIESVIGINFLSEDGIFYKNRKEAVAALKLHYNEDLQTGVEMILNKWGIEECNPATVLPGDPILIDYEGHAVVSVVALNGVSSYIIHPTDTMLQTVSFSKYPVIKAWAL